MTNKKEADNWRVMIAGGGTGGHLFPGLAVAEEIRKRHSESDILFITGRKTIESKILDSYGFHQTAIRVEGLKGRGWLRGIAVLCGIPYALYQSFRIIRTRSPHLVLGVGGYSSGPACLVARMMGVPTAIHEQNTYPGFTNRLLSRIVHKVFISFEESRSHFPGGTLHFTGNPVRQELLKNRNADKDADQRFTVFITGGSQGAMAINDASVKAMAIIKNKGKVVRVIHQTGETDFDRVREEYTQMGFQADVQPFIRDMAAAYGDADIVVSRAGATTVSELAALGKPSVLIPFPYAANNHQETNARVLADVGGAQLLLQEDLSGESLAEILIKCMDDRAVLQKMSEQALQKGHPDAAYAIVNRLEEMLTS